MSDVSTKTDSVTAMELDWELARALLGGTRAMRAAGTTYLPKWPKEDDEAHNCRLATAVLFPAYKRTISTLTGKPFSEPVTVGDDVPAQIAQWLQDADLRGRNIDAFAADVMESALGYGICGILVEYPKKAEGVKTVADERKAGLRPYFIQIHPWQVLGWRDEYVNGVWTLTQLRLLESVDEPIGDFGVSKIAQVRVLVPGAWQTYRKNDKKEWVLHEEGTTTLQIIPYVPVYGERVEFMVGKPPLIEVANLNVAHWQCASDQQTILHVARVPILAAIGVDPDTFEMTVGGASAVKIPTGGDLKFVEHTGKAIEAGANELEALEERMRQAGAELLVLRPGKITATQTATENAVGMCALHRIAQNLEDALDQALQIMALWVGEKSGGHVELFKDFGAASLAEASTQILLDSASARKISDETFFAEMQRRGIVSPDIDWQDEKERIDAQGPALGMIGAAGNVQPGAAAQNQASQDA
jgi:hypothetical protein